MKFKILTIFPNIFDSFLSTSIINKAIKKGLVSFEIIDFSDFTKNKYKRVDSNPIGGGPGLILMAQPIIDALNSINTPNAHKIIFSPRGTVFNQNKAIELSKKDEIILLCGHYEGIDERVYSYFDEEISIGDYILTGGETAAFVLIDAVTRLIQNVINKDSIIEETFNSPLIEYPQYTEPYEFNNEFVPDILYSGNHKAIEKYHLKQSLIYTLKYRPDLLKDYKFSKVELSLLEEIKENKVGKWEIDAIEKGKKFIKNH